VGPAVIDEWNIKIGVHMDAEAADREQPDLADETGVKPCTSL
jgi:hypothetical protein